MNMKEIIAKAEESQFFELPISYVQENKDKISVDSKVDLDDQQNSSTHVLVNIFIKKLNDINLSFKGEDAELRDTQRKLSDNFSVLLNELGERGLLSNNLNVNKKRPLDLLREAQINFKLLCAIDRRRDMEQQLLPIFEKYGLLYPGRKYVPSLSLYRSTKNPDKPWRNCEIPDMSEQLNKEDGANLTLHQRQLIYENYLMQSPGYARYDKNPVLNLVIANIGFVLSDKSKTDPMRKPVFVTLPIKRKGFIVCAEKSKNGTHSEDGLIDYFNSEEFFSEIISELKNNFIEIPDRKIHLLILDIHSTGEICIGCQNKLYKLQTDFHEDSFLERFKKFAETKGYIFSKKNQLQIVVRASGLGHPGEWNHTIDPNIPDATVWGEVHGDVRQYAPGIMLHLPPNYTKRLCTTKHSSGERVLPNYKSDIRESYENEVSSNSTSSGSKKRTHEESESYDGKVERIMDGCITRKKVTVSYQTAFANTNSKAKSIQINSSSEFPVEISTKDNPELFRKTVIL